MSSYQVAETEVQDRIDRIIAEHHKDLKDAKVDVRALMAFAEGDAVKLHGYPCAAIIKAVGLKERAQGLSDALIIIDAAWWKDEDRTERELDALIDHELTHIELQFDKHKILVRDDLSRPVIKMRLHDWQLGGFAQISARYGASALEVKGVKAISDRYGQLFWNWDRADAPGPAGAVVKSLLDSAQRAAETGSSGDENIHRSLAKIVPKDGSVTLESGGRSVTLTPESGRRIREAQKNRHRGREKAAI